MIRVLLSSEILHICRLRLLLPSNHRWSMQIVAIQPGRAPVSVLFLPALLNISFHECQIVILRPISSLLVFLEFFLSFSPPPLSLSLSLRYSFLFQCVHLFFPSFVSLSSRRAFTFVIFVWHWILVKHNLAKILRRCQLAHRAHEGLAYSVHTILTLAWRHF